MLVYGQSTFSYHAVRPAPNWLVSCIGRGLVLVSQRSRVRILYKHDIFSSFLFATAKVASITAMIFFHIILQPAVLIYDFHLFITSLYSKFITNLTLNLMAWLL